MIQITIADKYCTYLINPKLILAIQSFEHKDDYGNSPKPSLPAFRIYGSGYLQPELYFDTVEQRQDALDKIRGVYDHSPKRRP